MDGVGKGISFVGIGGGEFPYQCTAGGVLGDGRFGKCKSRGGFVHIGDRHDEVFLEARPFLVGGADAHFVAGFLLEVEDGFGLELVALNLERSVIIAPRSRLQQGIGEGVVCINIGAGEGAHLGTAGGVFGDGRRTQGDVGGFGVSDGGKDYIEEVALVEDDQFAFGLSREEFGSVYGEGDLYRLSARYTPFDGSRSQPTIIIYAYPVEGLFPLVHDGEGEGGFILPEVQSRLGEV